MTFAPANSLGGSAAPAGKSTPGRERPLPVVTTSTCRGEGERGRARDKGEGRERVGNES